MHEHLADTREAEMVEAPGAEPAQASARDRVRAYAAAWQGVADRWVPAPPEEASDDAGATRRLFLGTLAVDGLWSYEATTGRALAPDLRAALLADILRIAGLEDHSNPA